MDTKTDTPNFAAWNLDTLAKFAMDSYLRMQDQQDTIEQLRQDNKDLTKINRELLKGQVNESK